MIWFPTHHLTAQPIQSPQSQDSIAGRGNWSAGIPAKLASFITGSASICGSVSERAQIEMMVSGRKQVMLWWVVLLGVLAVRVQGIRFVIDKKECWHHEVPYDGDQVHVSYVVIKSESMWSFDDSPIGVDLVVEAPAGHQVHFTKAKVEDKFDFIAVRRGLYKFCFFNRNTIHETVDFDVHVGYHIVDPFEEHAKDEHIEPLMMQIERLEESMYSIQFEQHWLLAQTDRQEIVNKAMSKRFVYKAVFEAAALIGCSVLQVYLLQRLFEKKVYMSRV